MHKGEVEEGREAGMAAVEEGEETNRDREQGQVGVDRPEGNTKVGVEEEVATGGGRTYATPGSWL